MVNLCVETPSGFFNFSGRYKRIRLRYKGKPLPEYYGSKVKRLEELSAEEKIDIFHGDESHVCSEGYVLYGWQFPDDKGCILSEKSHRIKFFGMINRQSKCFWSTIGTTE